MYRNANHGYTLKITVTTAEQTHITAKQRDEVMWLGHTLVVSLSTSFLLGLLSRITLKFDISKTDC